MTKEHHFRFSTFREKLIEHLFLGELLRLSWQRGECSLEVAKPEVDSRGYDVIIERDGVVRHVQLKASSRGGATSRQTIHVGLAGKPAGCVIWIQFDPATLQLGPFLFFGSAAGQPLPDISRLGVARHTKGNAQGYKAERPDLRVVPKSQFLRLDTVEQVFAALFEPSMEADAGLERAFHALIRARLAKIGIDAPGDFPKLSGALPAENAPAWFPVAGMYGGFSYWGRREGGGLTVESWSRVVEGSGERHDVTADGHVLVERGFV